MRTRSRTGFNVIPENCAAVVFSHLGDDPRDRIALAQVSRVWRDAERTDASLPVAPSALIELAHDVGKQQYHELYWMSKAADLGDAEAMYWLGRFFLNILMRPRHQIVVLMLLNPLVQRRDANP